ncbi:MAG: hypothetical protein ACRDXE_11140 [Acidimicrobiales bacterium]
MDTTGAGTASAMRRQRLEEAAGRRRLRSGRPWRARLGLRMVRLGLALTEPLTAEWNQPAGCDVLLRHGRTT